MKALAGIAVPAGLSLLAVPLLAAAPGWSASIPSISVSGTAFVDLRDHTGADVRYRIRIDAVEDPEDGFQGSVTSQIVRGDLGRMVVLSKVTCVAVVGNAAWVGSVVTHSTNETLYAPGDVLITHVRDFGEVGDVVHQEAAKNLAVGYFDVDGDGDVDCHDRPALYPSTVLSGDIVIK
jgi:hypothetical protein